MTPTSPARIPAAGPSLGPARARRWALISTAFRAAHAHAAIRELDGRYRASPHDHRFELEVEITPPPANVEALRDAIEIACLDRWSLTAGRTTLAEMAEWIYGWTIDAATVDDLVVTISDGVGTAARIGR